MSQQNQNVDLRPCPLRSYGNILNVLLKAELVNGVLLLRTSEGIVQVSAVPEDVARITSIIDVTQDRRYVLAETLTFKGIHRIDSIRFDVNNICIR